MPRYSKKVLGEVPKNTVAGGRAISPDRKQTVADMTLDTIQALAQRADSISVELYGRLGPFMSEPGPEKDRGASAAVPTLPEYFSSLQIYFEDINRSLDRLHSVCQRLEI